ncbi:MAG: hypothetical protein WCW14_02160 [Candidatus Paceibacterota bacterium]|jgi:hypothetical protein
MQALSTLFGSQVRVKVMRLFLFNPHETFDVETLALRSRATEKEVKNEVVALAKSGLIKAKTYTKEFEQKKGSKLVLHKKKTRGFQLNTSFIYLPQLQSLLINTKFLHHEDLVHKLSTAGRIKLLIAAGVFTQDLESRVDLLIVGDNLKKNKLDKTVRAMEAEIGKELTYAAFDTADFQYRLGMYDKLLRDILEFPHEKVVNKLGL